MKKYAVVGNPIKHSRSPQIHQQFAKETGIELSYETLLAPTDAFVQSINDFFNSGGVGLNITVPFKEQAWKLCQYGKNNLTERAHKAGAVNTIKRNDDGSLLGDNTDGIGLVSDIQDNLHKSFDNASVLILGAGGAVRGTIEPILQAGCQHLHIANRTVEKAQSLCHAFNDSRMQASGLDDIADINFDIIINATSASLSGEIVAVPDRIFTPLTFIYDMMYGANDTPFINYAKQQGCQNCHDGLGMLVEQAAHGFYLWHGVMPSTKSVINALRADL